MAKRVLRIRHATAQANIFQGKDGEITVDLTKKVSIVHDGLTSGGFPTAAESLSNSPVAIAGSKDGKMSSAQATELVDATAKNVAQDNRMDGIDTRDTGQDTRMSTIEVVNTTQNSRLDTMDTKNTSQDSSINGNTTNITTNTTNIAANLVKINTNITNIANNKNRIIAIEVPPLSTGTDIAYLATVNEATLVSGAVYYVRIHIESGVTPTLKLNALAVITIKMTKNRDLVGKEMYAGKGYYFLYDGTNFIIQNPEKTFRGALITSTVNVSVPANVTTFFIPLNKTIIVTDSIHDPITLSTRFVVPAWATRVQLSCHVFSSAPTATAWLISLYVNGFHPTHVSSKPGIIQWPNSTSMRVSAESAIINVVGGDYFEWDIQHNHTTQAQLVNFLPSWFQMEIIE